MTDSENKISEPTVDTAVPGQQRLLAVLLYLACAPLFWMNHSMVGTPFWQGHRKQAGMLWALLGLMLLFFFTFILGASLLMVLARDWFESFPVEKWFFSLARKALLVWLVFWLYGISRCLRGRSDAIPLLGGLANTSLIPKIGLVVVVLLFTSLCLLPPCAMIADSQVNSDGGEGDVFVLYDDQGKFPRWMFSMAIWRLAHTTRHCLPERKLVLLPATKDNLDRALDQGSFLFAGTHGVSSGLLLQDGLYPPESRSRPVGGHLRFVYLAGCDSGHQHTAWQDKLHPASLRSFDRLTPTLEHLWRLWTEVPARLRALCEE